MEKISDVKSGSTGSPLLLILTATRYFISITKNAKSKLDYVTKVPENATAIDS